MRLRWIAGAVLSGGLCVAGAQQNPPALHQRSDSRSSQPATTIATGRTDLPETAEGEYLWGKNGDTITLYFEQGKLQGYMQKQLEPGDTGAALETLDFATSHIQGHALQFTTRQVHGATFSFDGHLERGIAASPDQPGYYLLTGTVTEHAGAGDDLHWTVSLQREPGS